MLREFKNATAESISATVLAAKSKRVKIELVFFFATAVRISFVVRLSVTYQHKIP